MKLFEVVFAPKANRDRADIYEWLAERASPDIAKHFVDGILNECESLRMAPYRGTTRSMAGLEVRTFGYKRSVSIVFTIDGDTVQILRLLYHGQTYG